MGIECSTLSEIVRIYLISNRENLFHKYCICSFTSIQNFYAVMGVTYLDRADPTYVQISRIASYFPFPRYDPW